MLNISIQTQPDDDTCGPTSLHAVYEYFGEKVSLEQIINEVERVSNGGTVAALLGKHALQHNYNATIYIYNLDLFDPSWFVPNPLDHAALIFKLEEQLQFKKTKRLLEATHAYVDFLNMGGEIVFRDLNAQLFKQYFDRDIPILAGLSATYLYQSMRERSSRVKGQMIYDDLRGEPCGHFVVLNGYDETHRHIIVADPHRENPLSNDNYYKVRSGRLITAIILGVLTYDANLLIIEPKKTKK